MQHKPQQYYTLPSIQFQEILKNQYIFLIYYDIRYYGHMVGKVSSVELAFIVESSKIFGIDSVARYKNMVENVILAFSSLRSVDCSAQVALILCNCCRSVEAIKIFNGFQGLTRGHRVKVTDENNGQPLAFLSLKELIKVLYLLVSSPSSLVSPAAFLYVT